MEPAFPEKAPIKPKGKMVKMYWKRIGGDTFENTFWKEIDDAKPLELMGDSLCELFSRPKRKKGKGKKKGGKKKGNLDKALSSSSTMNLPDHDEVELEVGITPDRENIIGLAIGRLKGKTFDYLRLGILQMSESVATPDLIDRILNGHLCPEPDEIASFKKYYKAAGERHLSRVQRFLCALSRVPHINKRLVCMRIKNTFATGLKFVEEGVATATKAIQCLEGLDNFYEWSSVILAAGNYMNGGSKSGGAFGFKIDILASLVRMCLHSLCAHVISLLLVCSNGSAGWQLRALCFCINSNLFTSLDN